MRPTWVSVVGILALVLGCLGLLGAGQMAMMPKIVQMQKEMFTTLEAESRPEQRAAIEPMHKMMDDMWGQLPPWFERYAVASGVLTMVVKGFYIFAAISLLQLKRSAPLQFYWAVGLSIAVAVVNAVAMAKAFSFMGIGMAFGGMVGVVLNLVLLLVVLTSDRSVFARPQPPPLRA